MSKADHFCLVSRVRKLRDILAVSHCLRGVQRDNFYALPDVTNPAVCTGRSEAFSYISYMEYNMGR